MTLVGVKTVLAFVLAAAGMTAAGSMLALLGRAEAKMEAKTLRAIHKVAGYVFAATLGVLAVLGARILSAAGDGLPLRGVIHWVLGGLLVIIAALKIVLVRRYKKLLKFAPALGLATIALALLVAFISVGFALLTGGAGDVPVGGEPAVRGSVVHESVGGEPAVRGSAGDAVAGEAVFRSSCAACHSVESDRGPAGLSGLFERESLASRGLPVTRENVRAQILDPVGRMPSFKSRLTDDELEDLLGYLETL